MTYIALTAVVGIVVLQASGGIPIGSVGGSLTIGLAFIAAALAVGLHDAWTNRRGVLGWIVSLIVAFAGVFIAAPLGGMLIAILLGDGSRSLMESSGPIVTIALVLMMVMCLAAAWGALRIVSRWR